MAAVAAVELVLLVVLGVVLLGRSVAASHGNTVAAAKPAVAAKAKAKARRTVVRETTRAPKHTARKAPTPVQLSRSQTTVSVLNGNGLSGAAASAAQLVRARGYHIGPVANAARTDYPRSLVMYRTGFRNEANRLAKDLGIAIVTPLDGRASKAGPQLTLIVGRKS